MSSQFALMWERRFGPFFATQFLGAFNDNFFKNALLVLITFQAGQLSDWSPGVLVNVAAGLFVLPFLLFSAWAGQLADKYEKSRLIRWTKVLEVAVMLLACVGFAMLSLPILLLTLFLMGTQSAFFGPVKYAILPQALRRAELMGGNALVESGTFVAILLGTIVGGLLVQAPAGLAWVSMGVVGVALLGCLSSWAIPPLPPVAPQLRVDWHPWRPTLEQVRDALRQSELFVIIVAISWFWFYGAVFLSQFPGFAAEVLEGDEKLITLLLTAFSLGIALGSLLCERLSGRRIDAGLVLLGVIGLSVFGLDLWWAGTAWVASGEGVRALAELLSTPLMWRILLDLLLVALSGGIYIVPLYALLQSRSDPTQRSRMIAVTNIISSLFMVLAAAMGASVLAAGGSVTQLFMLTALLNACFALYLCVKTPEFGQRFMLFIWRILRLRLRVEGAAHLPPRGAALLVSNHVSQVDGLIMMTACDRPVRVVVPYASYRRPLLAGLYRMSGAILLPRAEADAHRLEHVHQQILAALAAGECVGLFPEGGVRSNAEVGAFGEWLSVLITEANVPVVPVAVRGVQTGARTASQSGGLKGWWRRVTVAIAPSLTPTQADAEGLQQRVAALRGLHI